MRSCLFLAALSVLFSLSVSYDPAFSQTLALYNYVSYCNATSIQRWDCYWCQKVQAPPLKSIFTVTGNEDIFGYVFQMQNTIYVVIRGTVLDSIQNWINNANFVLTPLWSGSTVQVHSGFKKDTGEIYQGILVAIKALLNGCPSCSIMLTGHSLGGAISSILALELDRDLPSTVTFDQITYGSPRTGNPAFVTLHKSIVQNSYRVVNKKDIVPRLPTHLLNFFNHVPEEVWYGPSGGYKLCDNSGEDPTCSLSVNFLETNINDHLTYFGVDLRDGHAHGCS